MVPYATPPSGFKVLAAGLSFSFFFLIFLSYLLNELLSE